MGLLRMVAEGQWIDLDQWFRSNGGHFLTFGAVSGLFMGATAAPLLFRPYWARWLSGIGVLGLLGLVPLANAAAFRAFGLAGGDLELFYWAHAGQLFVAGLTLFLFNYGRGGLFPPRKAPNLESSANIGESTPQPEEATHEEFFDLQ